MTVNADLSPGFRRRILDRLDSMGFEDLQTFLDKNPTATYAELVDILGSDVSQKQLVEVQYALAIEKGGLRNAAKDALLRTFRKYLKLGWGVDSDFAKAGIPAFWFWSLRYCTGDLGAKIEQVGKGVWQAIETSNIPTGWIPQDSDDVHLTAAFQARWPECSAPGCVGDT